MGNSLFDQLKKTGLADKRTVHKARAEKHKQAKQQRQQKGDAPADEAARLAEQARREKQQRDRELNAERRAEADRKALAAQIRQLVETHRQPKGVGPGDEGIAYNFVDANKVKTVRVSKTVQQHLSGGRLAIVRLDEGYELVPNVVAERILARDPQWFVSRNDKVEVEDEDDPYKDYKIPDDLMW
jgi:uncharacterized protein YaiL (DUF2058 family)